MSDDTTTLITSHTSPHYGIGESGLDEKNSEDPEDKCRNTTKILAFATFLIALSVGGYFTADLLANKGESVKLITPTTKQHNTLGDPHINGFYEDYGQSDQQYIDYSQSSQSAEQQNEQYSGDYGQSDQQYIDYGQSSEEQNSEQPPNEQYPENVGQSDQQYSEQPPNGQYPGDYGQSDQQYSEQYEQPPYQQQPQQQYPGDYGQSDQSYPGQYEQPQQPPNNQYGQSQSGQYGQPPNQQYPGQYGQSQQSSSYGMADKGDTEGFSMMKVTNCDEKTDISNDGESYQSDIRAIANYLKTYWTSYEESVSNDDQILALSPEGQVLDPSCLQRKFEEGEVVCEDVSCIYDGNCIWKTSWDAVNICKYYYFDIGELKQNERADRRACIASMLVEQWSQSCWEQDISNEMKQATFNWWKQIFTVSEQWELEDCPCQ